jgi:hypothetical protein
MDVANQKRIKQAARREGHHSVFKTQGKSFMILNKRSMEKIAAITPETIEFLCQQRDKVPRSLQLP